MYVQLANGDVVESETGELRVAPVPFVRNAYNYDRDAASDAAGLVFPESEGKFGRTKQEFKEECDINTIVERFGLTGELPNDVAMPQSGDFTEYAMDYHSAMNLLLEADRAFMSFPADVRKRFDNDPAEMMAFVENPANRDEAIKLGFIDRPKDPPKPLEVRVIPDVNPPAPPVGAQLNT